MSYNYHPLKNKNLTPIKVLKEYLQDPTTFQYKYRVKINRDGSIYDETFKKQYETMNDWAIEIIENS